MINLIALIFCWCAALFCYFGFQSNSKPVRIGTFLMCFGAGCINLPYTIKWIISIF